MTIVYLFAGLILLSVLIAWYSYRTAFYSPEKRKEDDYAIPRGEQYEKERQRMLSLIRQMDEIPYEAVTISAQDGTKLAARYYHVRDGAPLQIQFHGYRGTAVRDFCGGNKLARESGQNTLVVDQRAHGRSGGTTITFGIQERLDCLCWAEYANQRFGSDTPVFLSGVSMGAATVLMAADLPLPPQVKGIIADCGYDSPEDILRETMRRWHYPQFPTWQLTRLGAKLFGHLDVRECSALESMKHARVPVLLIHGEADNVVPCEMAAALRDACASHAELLTVPGAGHGMSCYTDPAAYEKALDDFCKEVL